MTMLGLIVVFPQLFDLIDLMIEEKKLTLNRYKNQITTWKVSSPSFDKISPSRSNVKNYILTLKNVKQVYCINDIPAVRYSLTDGEKGKSLRAFTLKFQAVTQAGAELKLTTGTLKISPTLSKERYGHWLWPSYRYVFEEWQFQQLSTYTTKKFENPSILLKPLDMIRVKRCE